jgi:hypothetical protein
MFKTFNILKNVQNKHKYRVIYLKIKNPDPSPLSYIRSVLTLPYCFVYWHQVCYLNTVSGYYFWNETTWYSLKHSQRKSDWYTLLISGKVKSDGEINTKLLKKERTAGNISLHSSSKSWEFARRNWYFENV